MRLGEWAHGGLASAALALVATLGASAGCCVSPPSDDALVAAGFRTPRQTVRSFQTFVRAELPADEYRCFSQGFRARNGLSALSYGEARDELFRRQPWLKRIALAEVVGEGSVGEDVHWVDLEELGRTVRVKLVREDFFEILDGRGPVQGDDADFERLVRLESDGRRLTLRLPMDPPLADLDGIAEVLVARHWKIDDLSEPPDPNETAPRATP